LMAIGIPPAKAEDFEIAYKSKRDHDQDIKDAAKEISRRRMLAMTAYRNGDMDSYAKHSAVIDNMLQSYRGNINDWKRLVDTSVKIDPDTQFRKMLMEMWLKDVPAKDIIVNSNPAKE